MARSILDRRNRKGQIDQGPVLTYADSLEMIDALASSEPSNNIRFFVPSILGNDQSDVLAHGFFAGVAEHSLRTPIPTGDDAVQSLADDCVVGAIHDGSQQIARSLSLPSVVWGYLFVYLSPSASSWSSLRFGQQPGFQPSEANRVPDRTWQHSHPHLLLRPASKPRWD